MLNVRNNIMDRAASMSVEINGLDEVPWIVQGRPLFDFEGIEEETLSALGQNTEDLFLGAGKMNIAVFPNGKVEGLKIVSNQYNLLQHLDAINLALNNVPKAFQLEKIDIKTSPDGGRLWATMESGLSEEIVPGDKIKFRAVLQNSADTTKVMRFLAGAFRLVCSNGMVIPDSRFKHMDIKKAHKGSLDFEKDVAGFFGNMEASFEAVGYWKKYAQTKLDTPKLEDVFQMLECGPRVQEEIKSIPLRGQNTTLDQLINSGSSTLWDGYNAFTQRITDSDSLEAVKIDNGIKVTKAFDKMVMAA